MFMNARWIFLVSIVLLLSACATPMGGSFGSAEFTPEIQINDVWNAHAGKGQLGLSPVVVNDRIFALGANGRVAAFNKNTGVVLWRQQIAAKLFTAGLAEDNGSLFATTMNGELVALDEKDGKIKWQRGVNLNPNAKLTADSGLVLTILSNGNLAAFSSADGSKQWVFDPVNNATITSEIITTHQLAVIGLSNGNVAAISLDVGHPVWTKQLSNKGSVNQVTANADQLYASANDGFLGAYSLPSGDLVFKHKIIGAQGLSADSSQLYFADNQGFLWAFDHSFGIVSWKEHYFVNNNISAPVLFGNYAVIADGSGYLYWMDKNDGHLLGRNRFDSSGFSAKPMVSDGLLFVYSNDGTLYAYQSLSLAKNVT
jgi:outer membrane protein assembly factor BamB